MDPGISQAIGWLSTLIHIALAVGILVVALVRVRSVSATGAYLLAASGGLEALGSCCNRGIHTWTMSQLESSGESSIETMFAAASAVSMLVNFVTMSLLIAGLVVTGRALMPRKTS